MSTKAALPLWELVAHLERTQLVAWRKEFHASDDLETSCALHLMKLETTVTRYRGGLISVTISVLDKKESNCCAGYFRLKRGLNGLVQIESGTLTEAS